MVPSIRREMVGAGRTWVHRGFFVFHRGEERESVCYHGGECGGVTSTDFLGCGGVWVCRCRLGKGESELQERFSNKCKQPNPFR